MKKLIEEKVGSICKLDEEQLDKLEEYCEMMLDWNASRCNLTAITEKNDVVEKHLCDSILPCRLIPEGAYCIDVGTGAGLPGIPLKIVRPDIKLVMLDSLKKRIDFLDAATKAINIEATAIHARAEDAGRDASLREAFDIALTRAVAQTNILLEWTTPFLKVGGVSLMYKGQSASEELSQCEKELSIFNVTAKAIAFDAAWGVRTVICAEKYGNTPKVYPRKAGSAKKDKEKNKSKE